MVAENHRSNFEDQTTILNCYIDVIRVSSSMSHQSAEERVVQNHRSDLLEGIVHPLSVVNKLIQEGVVSHQLAQEVGPSVNRTVTEKNSAILEAVSASIRADPRRIHVFLAVLETQVEAAPIARRMRRELGGE